MEIKEKLNVIDRKLDDLLKNGNINRTIWLIKITNIVQFLKYLWEIYNIIIILLSK